MAGDDHSGPSVFFEVLDFVLGVFPLVLWLIVFGLTTLGAFAWAVEAGLVFSGIWAFMYWVARGLLRSVMNLRSRDCLRSKRRSLVVRLSLFVVLGVLTNLVVMLTGLNSITLWLVVWICGPVYVATRHLLLIFLDVQKEKLHGG